MVDCARAKLGAKLPNITQASTIKLFANFLMIVLLWFVRKTIRAM